MTTNYPADDGARAMKVPGLRRDGSGRDASIADDGWVNAEALWHIRYRTLPLTHSAEGPSGSVSMGSHDVSP